MLSIIYLLSFTILEMLEDEHSLEGTDCSIELVGRNKRLTLALMTDD